MAMVLESRKLAEDVEAMKIERPIILEDIAKSSDDDEFESPTGLRCQCQKVHSRDHHEGQRGISYLPIFTTSLTQAMPSTVTRRRQSRTIGRLYHSIQR